MSNGNLTMNELDEPLQARFAEHVDTVYRALDDLQPLVNEAVEALGDVLLTEHRLIVCGLGIGASLAQVFASNLLGRMLLERPGLPVIALGCDGATLGSVAESHGLANALARPIQALAQPGDVVLLVCPGPGQAMSAAARAAHSRGARVIALSGEAGADAGPLATRDIELRVPTEDPGRTSECQLLLLNCLAELIEQRLFGNG
jgi:phosphoheptose isomerase